MRRPPRPRAPKAAEAGAADAAVGAVVVRAARSPEARAARRPRLPAGRTRRRPGLHGASEDVAAERAEDERLGLLVPARDIDSWAGRGVRGLLEGMQPDAGAVCVECEKLEATLYRPPTTVSLHDESFGA